jgi:hypothetical protein
MNRAKQLPDAYAKHVDSNNYKLLQLANLLYVDLNADLKKINQSRDLYNAAGKTLDYYGAMVGEKRSGASDDQFRTKIFNRIGKNVANPDCNSIITAIAQTLGLEPSTITIQEDENLSVKISGITLESVKKSGYTAEEIAEMISKLLTIGVTLSATSFSGTLFIIDKKAYWTFSSEVFEKYPYLASAWLAGQSQMYNYGNDVGLSGYGEVPEEFLTGKYIPQSEEYKTKGTYSGGTLGMII